LKKLGRNGGGGHEERCFVLTVKVQSRSFSSSYAIQTRSDAGICPACKDMQFAV
jgi:hypothetical protein